MPRIWQMLYTMFWRSNELICASPRSGAQVHIYICTIEDVNAAPRIPFLSLLKPLQCTVHRQIARDCPCMQQRVLNAACNGTALALITCSALKLFACSLEVKHGAVKLLA
jgi:hypothetical protein